MPRIFAGTSGFAYPSWKPDFYPAKLPATKFLEYYGSRLNCVEINYTFRTLPAASTLTKWVAATPEHFVFCPKAHMRLTHMMKLKEAGPFTEVFLKAIEPLRTSRRLGPVLFQLPPSFRCDVKVLAEYLPLLPRDVRFAFEFRHASWLADEVYALLRDHNAALCVAESETLEVPEVVTADFIYFRLRKPDYSPEDRVRIADNARRLSAAGRDLYIFFKHEDTPHGALYAEEVLKSS